MAAIAAPAERREGELGGTRGSAAGRAGRVDDAGEQALPRGAQKLELLVAEVVHEHRPHAREVRRARRGELAPAGRGERGERAARVARARLAGDQPLPLEAVD